MNRKNGIVLVIFFLIHVSLFSQSSTPIYLGADLSYINELEDCGGQYYENGNPIDPYSLFANKGANIVRLRLWHTPDWTTICGDTNVYSTLADVKTSISRAKTEGMSVLLDFHYSDNWADPSKQFMPEAWQGITDLNVLKDSIYTYTYEVLDHLAEDDLLPDFVQIGNEINNGFVDPTPNTNGMDWPRAVALINKAAEAVDDIAFTHLATIQKVLHIAQPDHVSWWLSEATSNGIFNYDIIGMSYYPKWSSFDLEQVGEIVGEMRRVYDKQVWIVETASPWTLQNFDGANNIFGDSGSTLSGYAASPTGQRDFLIDLTQALIDSGGTGVIYWEPAWISTSCCTQWEQGSSWENASFFDHGSSPISPLPAFEFFSHPYQLPLSSDDDLGSIKLEMFPNPTTGSLTIKISESLNEALQLRILDVKGRLIKKEFLSGGPDEWQLDTTSWPSGVYLLEFYTKDKTARYRLVRQ